MAVLKLHTYSKEKSFYENELKIVRQELEELNNDKIQLQNDFLKAKKDNTIFSLKYNITALLIGLFSGYLENTLPGSMVVTFAVQSILEEEMTNLEGIKVFEDRLDDDLNEKEDLTQINAKLDYKRMKKYYLQDRLYMLELIKQGCLKFELKNGKMVVIVLPYPLYCSYLEFKELYDKEIFLPDYYQDKKVNIKTLQKQIKIK